MPENSGRQGRGCFFYGCLTVILVFVGVIAGIYFGTRQAVKYAVSVFTTNAPAAIPSLGLPEAERARMARSLRERAAEKLRGSNGTTLVLDEKDLNVLVGASPDTAAYEKQIYLRPAGTQLEAHVSVPLDQFDLWQQFTRRLHSKDLQGRYFNGIALLNPQVTNGNLVVHVRDLLVNGKSLPGEFTGKLKNFDLTSGLAKDPSASNIFRHVQNVQVRDGKLEIELKPSSPP